MESCSKCGSPENIRVHHVSYLPEITILLCESCHRTVHYKARRENQCPRTPEEVAKLSKESYHKRTRAVFSKNRHSFSVTLAPNIRLNESIQYNPVNGKISCSSWYGMPRTYLPVITERGAQSTIHTIHKKRPYTNRFVFIDTLAFRIRLREELTYYPDSGNISYSSGFEAKDLPLPQLQGVR